MSDQIDRMAFWPLSAENPRNGGRLFVWFRPPGKASLWWYEDFQSQRFEDRCGYQVNEFDYDLTGSQTLYYDLRAQPARLRGARTSGIVSVEGYPGYKAWQFVFPYADGGIDMDLYGYNDWTVMSYTTCWSLLGERDPRCHDAVGQPGVPTL